MKLFESEIKVMEVLWQHGTQTAKQISDILKEETGWNINTTYTVIKKCIQKGAVERKEPNFLCCPLVTKEEIQQYEVEELINKFFDGSSDMLFASLIKRKKVPRQLLEDLHKMVDDQE